MNTKIRRNDPCPCGSGKKFKKCCMLQKGSSASSSWIDGEGLHTIAKGEKPTEAEIEKMTKEYQNQIRNSPMWDEMVKEFGIDKAEELLQECKAKVE